MAKTFYFTYGCEGHPFSGGWTEIEAEDMETACGAFRAYHPDKVPHLLNCCSVYAEEDFKETCMYKKGVNLGKPCQERICITREILGGAEQ